MRHETVLKSANVTEKDKGVLKHGHLCMLSTWHTKHRLYTLLHLQYPLNPSKLGVRYVRFLPDRSGCFKQFVVHGDTHGKVYADCTVLTAVSLSAAGHLITSS
jgi:hypothetical protein